MTAALPPGYLDRLEEIMHLYPEGTHACFVESRAEGCWNLDADRLREMIRLCRLAQAMQDLVRDGPQG